jgi:hypothetical protein
MSSGVFTDAFYEMSAENGGYIMTCRVQPETLEATFAGTANAAPSGPATAPGSATISQGRRSAGVNMRYVTIAWTGAPPTGYKAGSTIRLPVLDPAVYAEWTRKSTGTYLATAARIAGRNGETVR